MHVTFPSNLDQLRVSIIKRPDVPPELPEMFCLLVTRNHCPESNFTRDELHRVLDNARDVLLFVADKDASSFKGEFGGAR